MATTQHHEELADARHRQEATEAGLRAGPVAACPAVHGVLLPILVDDNGPRWKAIGGNYRKAIADELGYDCPEVFQSGLTEDEERTLARALNLSRWKLSQEQKQQLIADQLREIPEKSIRWVGKQLGIHHATVSSVRGVIEAIGQIIQFERTVEKGVKGRPVARQPQVAHRPPAEPCP